MAREITEQTLKVPNSRGILEEPGIYLSSGTGLKHKEKVRETMMVFCV